MKKLTTLLFFTIVTSLSFSQETEILNVKSLDFSVEGSSFPNALIESENYIYFTAQNNVKGRELWKMDKSSKIVSIVKDIRPGGTSSLDDYNNLGGLIDEDLLIFFATDDPDEPLVIKNLWRTDGTEEGTYKLDNIRPGEFNDYVHATLNGEFYFVGKRGGGYDKNLYKTNGTIEGTFELFNNDESFEEVTHIFVFNNTLYFTANYQNIGLQLWKMNSDGNSFELVSNIGTQESEGISFFNEFLFLNDQIYFYANDGVHGNELWKTTGELEGTVMVKDIYPDGTNVDLNNSSTGLMGIVHNNVLYFSAKSEDNDAYEYLYKTDGTAEGTIKVNTSNNTNSLPLFFGFNKNNFIEFGDKIIFKAIKSGQGDCLWVTDGTQSGTIFLKDILPGNYSNGISDFTVRGDEIYFLAYSDIAVANKNLWKTNGTTEGTVKVFEDVISSNLINTSSSSLFFAKHDDVNGVEVNELQPQSNVPLIVWNINRLGSTKPGELKKLNGKLVFHSDYKNIIITEGELEASIKLDFDDFPGTNFSLYDVEELGNNIFISGFKQHIGSQIFKYNTTMQNLELFKQFTFGSDVTTKFKKKDDLLFFNGDGSLWKTNGFSEETSIISGTEGYLGNNFHSLVYNNKLYYSGNFPNQHAIHTLDMTQSHTEEVINLPGPNWTPLETATIVDKFRDGFLISNYQLAGNNSHIGNLYFSKGLQSNTIKLIDVDGPIWDIWSGFYGGVLGEKAVFFEFRQEYTPGIYLYVTDGTPEGTHYLNKSFFGMIEGKVCGNYLYFLIIGDNEYKLYRTDGTEEGTVFVEDIYTEGGSNPDKGCFTCTNQGYFIYTPNFANRQVKMTDGIVTKTFNLNFTNELDFTNNPTEGIKEVFVIDDKLYLVIVKSDSGKELYVTSIADIELSTTFYNSTKDNNLFTLLPNPTKDLVTIEMNANQLIKQVKIYNLSGALISTIDSNENSKMAIDSSNLTSGIYIVEVWTNSGKSSKKLIKK